MPAVEGAVANVDVHWVEDAHVVDAAATPLREATSLDVNPVPTRAKERLVLVVSKGLGVVLTPVSVGFKTRVPVAVLGAGEPLVTVSV